MIKPQLLDLKPLDENRHTSIQVKIRIPKQYRQSPVISQLISHHQIQVNFLAALLAENTENDGWFHLELIGKYEDIKDALIELDDLNVELWYQSEEGVDGW